MRTPRSAARERSTATCTSGLALLKLVLASTRLGVFLACSMSFSEYSYSR